MDRNFERGRQRWERRRERGLFKDKFRNFYERNTELSTINRERGGGREGEKRLVWIGIGLEFEPRRVFQRGLNGVFFRWCDSSRANEESRGGGRKDDAIVT